MVNYDETLQKFFAEMIVFLNKRRSVAKEEIELKRIDEAIRCVSAVAKNPREYANYNIRQEEGLVVPSEALMLRGNNNRVYLLYSRFMFNDLPKLYSDFDFEREGAQKKLLDALKQMKIENASNVLGAFVKSFQRPEAFAVHEKVPTR